MKPIHSIFRGALLAAATFLAPVLTYAQTATLGAAQPFIPAQMGFNTNRGGNNSAGNPFNESQAVSMLSGQSANLMRFPGGDVGNRYNWRTDFVTGTNSGTLGRQAFFSMCASMNADAVLVANMFGPNNDPANWTAQEMIDEAVAWLQFMNTAPYPYAAQGYNKPVQYWELGNEFYYANFWTRTNPDVSNPSEYLPFAKNMADALQAAQNAIDPSVDLKFIVVGKAPGQFRNPTTANDATADTWATALGGVSPRWFDAVQFHPYINNRNWTAASQPFGVNDAEIKWYFSATHNMPSLLTRYIADAVDNSVELWLTEYGTGVIPVTTDATMNTWMNALAEADLILALSDEADVTSVLLRHQVYTSRFGLFHYTGSNVLYRTPWSYVTEILNPILTSATDSYPVTTGGITTFTGSFQFNGAGTPANTVLGYAGARYSYEPNIPEIRVRAYRMPDGKTKIALVNKVSSNRSITLGGTAALGSGTLWQMAAALGAINNGGGADVAPITPTNITLSSGNSTVTLPGYSLTVLTITPAPTTPVASIAVSDATASEPANHGQFTVSLSPAPTGNVTVNLTRSGTATNGTDYASIPTTLVVGTSGSATIPVTVLNDTLYEGNESVSMTLASGTGYTLGSPSSANITISDDESVPVVTISAASQASEPGSNGSFTITLSPAPATPVNVNLSVSGTASAGADYTALPASVSVGSSGTATVPVSVIDDAAIEGSETVVATVAAGTGYTVGAPSNATVTIADNDSATPVTVTLVSQSANDGYVTESTETSNTGGSNAASGTGSAALRVGDTATDQQVKTILSFDTSSIPDGATITAVTIRLQRGSVNGTSPFGTHGQCRVDIKSGAFGAVTLENSDFEVAADSANVAALSTPAANGDWASGSLSAPALALINKTGTTQFRVYFQTDDNNDNGRDDVGFFPGEASSGTRPELIVSYAP